MTTRLSWAAGLPTSGARPATSTSSTNSPRPKEIAYAQTHGNAKRVDGRETALAQMNANCTDAVLRSDAQRKVDEAHAELERVLTQASQ
jgi:hypothetical protein